MEDVIIAHLKEQGYSVGGRRMIIIQELCKRNRIENAEDFWLSLREEHGISWATVYTNLRLLVKMGIMEKAPGPHKAFSYQIVPQENTAGNPDSPS